MTSPFFPAFAIFRSAGLGICLLGGVANAALIASDSFLTEGSTDNYVAATLNGQVKTGGTFGYYTGTAAGNQVAGWMSGTGAFSASIAAPGGIFHPYATSSGGPNDGRVIATGNGNQRIQYRDFVSTTPPPSADYYFSALMRKSALEVPGNTYVGISASRAANLNGTVPTTGIFVGFTGSSLAMFYSNGTALVSQILVSSAAASTSYMTTLHYNVSTGLLTPMVYDQNGTLVNNPALNAVTATVNTTTDLGAFHFSIGAEFVAGGANMSYDELRFGTELADVMIPEASSVALLLGGLGAFGLVRRRGTP